jgi:hypothetical protein
MRLTVTSACRCWRILAAAAAALTRPSAVAAEWVIMNFDSIADYNMVGDYYGSYEGGPLYGIVFSGGVTIHHGGVSTYTDKEPSFPAVVSFYTAISGLYLTAHNGFTGLTFQYGSQESSNVVTVYDGPDTTGNILANVTLPATDLNAGLVDAWSNVTIPFSGVAKSVAFPQLPTFFVDDIWVLRNPPTQAPTKPPTHAPTKAPTHAPSKAPTQAPTKRPTKRPTKSPVKPPTKPVKTPTRIPVRRPRKLPTKAPTRKPRQRPRRRPAGRA